LNLLLNRNQIIDQATFACFTSLRECKMDFVIATRLTPEVILPVKETRCSQMLVLFSLHNSAVRPQRRVSIHTGIQLTLPRGTVMNVKIFPDLLERCSVTSEPRTYDAEYNMELIINVRNYGQLQECEVSKGINPTIMDSIDCRWTNDRQRHSSDQSAYRQDED
jgi:dUTPase